LLQAWVVAFYIPLVQQVANLPNCTWQADRSACQLVGN